MIYSLIGKIIKKTLNAVVVELRRGGLLCTVPDQRCGRTARVWAGEATLYTVMSVTENDISPTASPRRSNRAVLSC
ncbi:MAG: OB-fold domain-containing protein [Faecalibacterium sp.]